MGDRTTRGRDRGYGGAMGVIWEVYNMAISREAREFAEICACVENARFEKANKSVSSYVTESELQIIKEIAVKLNCSQSEVIRRAARLYGILCGYEQMGGEIIARPGAGMNAWGKNEINLSEKIERRGGAAE